MKRGFRTAGAFVGALLASAIVLSGVSVSAHADTAQPEPSPSSTSVVSDVPVSVVIPDLNPAPTPAPSSSTTPSPGGVVTPVTPVTPPASTCSPGAADAAPTAAAQPSESAGVLVLDLKTVAADEWLVAKASGFTPGEMVQVVVSSEADVVDSYKADPAGNLTARFRVPEETRSGDHVVEATGWASCAAKSAAFVVVTDAVAGSIPYVWWVLMVVGVLLAALAVTAFYFRNSFRRWFSGGMNPVGSAP